MYGQSSPAHRLWVALCQSNNDKPANQFYLRLAHGCVECVELEVIHLKPKHPQCIPQRFTLKSLFWALALLLLIVHRRCMSLMPALCVPVFVRGLLQVIGSLLGSCWAQPGRSGVLDNIVKDMPPYHIYIERQRDHTQIYAYGRPL